LSSNAIAVGYVDVGSTTLFICSTRNFTALSEMYLQFISATGDIVTTSCSATNETHQGDIVKYGIPGTSLTGCTMLFSAHGFSQIYPVSITSQLRGGTFTCVAIETDLGHLKVNSTPILISNVRGKFWQSSKSQSLFG